MLARKLRPLQYCPGMGLYVYRRNTRNHSCCILYVRTQMLGLLSMAIGIWGVVVSVEGDYEVLTGSNLVSGAVLLIVSGFITIVVSMFGFCGAAGMWRPILVIVSFRRPPRNFSLSIELCQV